MAPRHGARRNATPTGPGVELRGRSVSGRTKNPQELYVTDQNAPYLAAIVLVMFWAGCVLVVVSLRHRHWERDRWFSPVDVRTDRPPQSERRAQ
jgi:hypothetical protein